MWESIHKYKLTFKFSFFHFLIISFILQKISNSPINKEASKNNFRGLVTGEDIVKEINEECQDNINILKYTVVLNSTAFLANLSKTSRRQLYSSIEELDGENIGMEKGKTFIDKISFNFPNSEIYNYTTFDSELTALLKGEIKAFLLEESVAKYYAKQIDEITYLEEKLGGDYYGFAFPLNYTKERIRTQFNEYLSAIKTNLSYNDILKYWTENTSFKKIDKELTGINGVINAGINTKVPPFAYKENNEILGFEVDLLYRFAKHYGYQVQIRELTTEDQTNNIVNDNIDLVLGCYSITDQRKKKMFFSEPTHRGDILVAIKNDNKNKNNTATVIPTYGPYKKLIVKNQYGVNKNGNILNFPVTGLSDEITGECAFPEILSEIYTFECKIPGLSEVNPMVNGFKFGTITDIIVIDDDISLTSLNSYIPSHILGANVNSEVDHQGTMCPKMNVDLAGVDNVEQTLSKVNLEFGIYRSSTQLPETIANLKIIKGDDSCTSKCQESKKIYLTNLNILVRYACSCNFNFLKSSKVFTAEFDSMTFSYTNNPNKVLNMAIRNLEITQNAMSNLLNNTAKFPEDLTNLNTFVVQKFTNDHCVGGKFTFNALGVLYKSISEEQKFISEYPITTTFVLKKSIDLEEAEILISIQSEVYDYVKIKKGYYENTKNEGEYLYLTSNNDISIYSSDCKGNSGNYGNRTYNNSISGEKNEGIELRDDIIYPKWVIILFVLLIAGLSMTVIHLYIKKLSNDTEYVVRYTKKESSNSSNAIPNKST